MTVEKLTEGLYSIEAEMIVLEDIECIVCWGLLFITTPIGGCMRGFKLNYNNSKTWQNKLGVKKSSSCTAQQKFCANRIPYAF